MFHATPKPLKNRYHRVVCRILTHACHGAAAAILAVTALQASAGDAPAYQPYFNQAKGFKPAQPNLAAVFLEMAGSFEAYGSPEPFIRHVMAEHARIDAKFLKITGHGGSTRPAYLTVDYIANLMLGWKKLEEPLKLDSFTRECGRNLRYAIMGGWHKSPAELVAGETKLTDGEKDAYRALLAKPFFGKADFPAMEAFYKSAYDKLSDEGQGLISQRTDLGRMDADKRAKILKSLEGGTFIVSILNDYQDALAADMGKETRSFNSDRLKNTLIERLKLADVALPENIPAGEKDGIQYAHLLEFGFIKRFQHLEKTASPEQAKLAHDALVSMVDNLMGIAQSEFEAAVFEQAADQKKKDAAHR